MNKIVVDIGIESVSMVKADIKKGINIVKSDTIPSSRCFNKNGTVNIESIADVIKNFMGNDKNMDVDIILPSYMTDYKYSETQTKEKIADSRESYAGKLVNTINYTVGDNGNYKIFGTQFFNQAAVNELVNKLFDLDISIRNVITQPSINQKMMPLYNYDGAVNSNGTHVLLDMGFNKINIVVFDNNLPIYVKETGYSLYDLYSSLAEKNSGLSFEDFLVIWRASNPSYVNQGKVEKVIIEPIDDNSFDDAFNDDMYTRDISESIEESEKSEVENIDTKMMSYIVNEINNLMRLLSQEIREVVDFTRDEYGAQLVDIRTNSITAAYFLDNLLSDIFDVFMRKNLEDDYVIENTPIHLASLEEKSAALMGCIAGLIVVGTKAKLNKELLNISKIKAKKLGSLVFWKGLTFILIAIAICAAYKFGCAGLTQYVSNKAIEVENASYKTKIESVENEIENLNSSVRQLQAKIDMYNGDIDVIINGGDSDTKIQELIDYVISNKPSGVTIVLVEDTNTFNRYTQTEQVITNEDGTEAVEGIEEDLSFEGNSVPSIIIRGFAMDKKLLSDYLKIIGEYEGISNYEINSIEEVQVVDYTISVFELTVDAI